MGNIDPERSARLRNGLLAARLDAIICAHPKNVLLLAGYWPIIGNSVAVSDAEGHTTLIVPEDELEYSRNANADEVIPFQAGDSTLDDICPTLKRVLKKLDQPGRRIAIERHPISEEASYVAMTQYGFGISHMLREILPQCSLDTTGVFLDRERAVLTPFEQEQVREAAEIACEAFSHGANEIRTGMTEFEAAQDFEKGLSAFASNKSGIRRARGMVSCMSGERSGNAYGAFAMSSNRQIRAGELLLMHCNSHVDGFWTDITRTYVIGDVPNRIYRMFEALLEASRAGIASVKAGVRAEDVDRAVREALNDRGFGNAFKHSTGHGVGYSAIDATAIPRLRAHSPDVLEAGMVMNIEPGIYFERFGGMRQCDMVLVTETGADVLTKFQNSTEELNVRVT